MSRFWKFVLGLLGVAFLFWNPMTRTVILWILPLGSGIDDLIVVSALVVVLFLSFVKGWISIPQFSKFIQGDKNHYE